MNVNEQALNVFNELTQDGNVGFYNKCESIEVFGFNNETKEAFNILTLIVFEDTEQDEAKELVTQKLNKFKGIKHIKWGIQRRIISIGVAKKLFQSLQGNEFRIDKELKVGKLHISNKQYVQSDDTYVKPQLNQLLKNNFHCGSYIIEAFDNSKENIRFLLDAPASLNSFSESVSEILPISLGSVSDRLGNIIFQFPINICKVKTCTLGQDKGFQLAFSWHPKITAEPQLQVVARNEFDDVVLNSLIKDIENNTPVLMETSNHVSLEVINQENNLIIHKEAFTTIKQIGVNMGLVSPQNRFFSIDGIQKEISIIRKQPTMLMGDQGKDTCEWVRTRKYKLELKALESSKSFIQYKGLEGETEKALGDVRELINQFGDDGVYLWDPYLSAKDIKSTLYYLSTDAELRAITDIRHISQERKEFETDDKAYLFLNLEVRRRFQNYGSKFHDRFLIFPLEQPKVWSLGTSVNSLGKSHHILQEVKNAQHILNAFNELWADLAYEECLVWKSI